MTTMLDKTRDDPQNEPRAPETPPPAERAAPQVDVRKPDEPPKHDPKAKSGGIVGTLKAHPLVAGLVLLALIVAALGGLFYWMYASQFESTDDAFIDGRVVSISPEVVGYITLVP
jgi:membrane fusion protein, multidrug efflux system